MKTKAKKEKPLTRRQYIRQLEAELVTVGDDSRTIADIEDEIESMEAGAPLPWSKKVKRAALVYKTSLYVARAEHTMKALQSFIGKVITPMLLVRIAETAAKSFEETIEVTSEHQEGAKRWLKKHRVQNEQCTKILGEIGKHYDMTENL